MKSDLRTARSAKAGEEEHTSSRREHRSSSLLRNTLQAVLTAAVLTIAMLPLATAASASGGDTLTINTPTDATTTGVVVSGSVTTNGDPTFAQVVYEPSGTPITSSSPTAGTVILTTGVETAQAVSVTVDQLTPNTPYVFELQAVDEDNANTYDSSPADASTTAVPTGPGTPIDPPNDPSSNGIFTFCDSDPHCVNDINGVRAAQEQLRPLVRPTNWSSLTGAERIFVWADLERVSRGEAAIPNLVDTYQTAVDNGVATDRDPDLSGLPGSGGSIWAGSFPSVLGAIYAWMYFDGPGGSNGDCQGNPPPQPNGCWGHRDIILGNSANFGSNPTEMDADAGTDNGGNKGYAAIVDVNPNAPPPGNIVWTWAEEQQYLNPTPTVTKVSPSSGPLAGGTVIKITGTGFVPGSTTVVIGQGHGAGTGAIPAAVSKVTSTSITATTGAGTKGGDWSVYVVTPGGTSKAATAGGFTYWPLPDVTSVSPGSGPIGGGTSITVSGKWFAPGSTVVIGQGHGTTGAIKAVVSKVTSTSITAKTGGGALAGKWNVYVVDKYGTSKAGPAVFRYKA